MTTDTAPIPLVDLGWQHRQISPQVLDDIGAVLDAGAFVGGPDVAAFEAEYADWVQAPHCIGVANGTDALELALRGVGMDAGATVVLPANTFIATAEAVARAGCRVRLVDCEPEHQLIDVDAAAAAVADGADAVIAVDLFGQIPRFEDLESLGVPVIEDAAQSQGAQRLGRRAGTFGSAAGTSFYPGKNLGAYGDAGAVITNDDAVAHTVRTLANHGSTKKYEHDLVGVNSRLDTVQAVVLRAKLARLDSWNDLRRAAADHYHTLLAEIDGVVRPGTLAGNTHVWHLYVIEVDHRDRVLARLHEAGIGAGIHYPTPVHMTKAFAHLGLPTGSFPAAERLADRILSLPLFPGITESQQERVVSTVAAAIEG